MQAAMKDKLDATNELGVNHEVVQKRRCDDKWNEEDFVNRPFTDRPPSSNKAKQFIVVGKPIDAM